VAIALGNPAAFKRQILGRLLVIGLDSKFAQPRNFRRDIVDLEGHDDVAVLQLGLAGGLDKLDDLAALAGEEGKAQSELRYVTDDGITLPDQCPVERDGSVEALDEYADMVKLSGQCTLPEWTLVYFNLAYLTIVFDIKRGRSAMRRLEGRCAIVTGGGSGIGRASALRLAVEGAAVLVVGRREDPLKDTVAQATRAGGKCRYHIADAADEGGISATIDHCVKEFGGLHIFFANAGNTDSVRPFVEQTVAQWEGMFRDNVVTAFVACKLAGKYMAENGGGSIILNSSTGSLRARGGTEAYGAAKAAVNHLTMTAACAFAGKNVRVNAILPGLTETGLTKPMFDWARNAGKEDSLGKLTPMQRPGHTGDMAGVVAFLASDDAAYVDGQLIPVDGGISATHPAGKFVY